MRAICSCVRLQRLAHRRRASPRPPSRARRGCAPRASCCWPSTCRASCRNTSLLSRSASPGDGVEAGAQPRERELERLLALARDVRGGPELGTSGGELEFERVRPAAADAASRSPNAMTTITAHQGQRAAATRWSRVASPTALAAAAPIQASSSRGSATMPVGCQLRRIVVVPRCSRRRRPRSSCRRRGRPGCRARRRRRRRSAPARRRSGPRRAAAAAGAACARRPCRRSRRSAARRSRPSAVEQRVGQPARLVGDDAPGQAAAARARRARRSKPGNSCGAAARGCCEYSSRKRSRRRSNSSPVAVREAQLHQSHRAVRHDRPDGCRAAAARGRARRAAG